MTTLLFELESSAADPEEYPILVEEFQKLCSWLEPEDLCDFASLLLAVELGREAFLRELQVYFASQDFRPSDARIPILKGDGLHVSDPEAIRRAGSVVVILDNLRSAFNVGSIFRTAECLGLKELALCGITAVPPHPKLCQTAMGTQEQVRWKYFGSSLEAISYYREHGYQIVALETAAEARSVFEAQPCFPLALLLGNESLGLEESVLAQADLILQLPVQGWKNSLNVGVAFAVTAYQLVFGQTEL